MGTYRKIVGFNIKPDATLKDVLALKERTNHSTMAVTDDGTENGKLLGIITSKIILIIGNIGY